jgi:nucleoside-diphosphate-sugar epimerase
MTILITGATGLVGSALSSRLQLARSDIVTTSRSPVVAPGHLVADLSVRDETLAVLAHARPDVVAHLAGGSHLDPQDLYVANVVSTVNLIETAAAIGLRPRFVIAGSAAEYGSPGTGLIDSRTSLQPQSDYGRAKAAQTTIALELARRFGLEASILRPFNIYSHTSVPAGALRDIGQQLLDQHGPRRRIECGRLDIVRDYVSLDLVTEAFERSIDTQPIRPVLNICSGSGVPLGEIVTAMARELRVEIEFQPVDRLVALPAAQTVVGDPSDLTTFLGPRPAPSPDAIARATLQALSPGH